MKMWIDWEAHEVFTNKEYEEMVKKLRSTIEEDFASHCEVDFLSWLDDTYTASELYNFIGAKAQMAVKEEFDRYIQKEVEKELGYQLTGISCVEVQ